MFEFLASSIRVVAKVYHIVKHAHRSLYCVLQQLLIELAPFDMCLARFTEPRLHTAVSSLDVFSVISVQRFELCTTPAWSCGDLMLHGILEIYPRMACLVK